MIPLSAQDMIRIWELGQRKHPIDQALVILQVALPSKDLGELARLSVGQRDSSLLSIREQTLGPILHTFAQCPECEENLEFSLNIPDVRVVPDTGHLHETHRLTCDGYELLVRLPNSLDMAAIVDCDGPAHARETMFRRCILESSIGGVDKAPEELPESIISEVGKLMGRLDPQADIQLSLDCPNCGHHWQITFDIATFFWKEISAQAKRLMLEVHELAQAYGWRESEILSMSPTRRQFYLEMVS